MKVGKTKYNGGKKVFKIKDGDNVYRILPPLGKLADAGRFSQYYRIEWGYKGTNGRMRPFQDCRKVNYQNKMVEVESAAYLFRQEIAEKKKAVIADFKTGKATQQQVKDVNELSMQYNLDSKHYINAVSLNGEIGLLKIGHRAKLALDAEIQKLRDKGVDPTSVDNGRFFNFFRSGTGLDTTYQITTYKEQVEVNGDLYEKEVPHVMDSAFLSRLETEAYELSNMYPAPTSEEVERIVKEGPTAVDEILGNFNNNSGSPTAPSGSSAPTSSTPVGGSQAAAAANVAAPAPETKETVSDLSVDAKEVELTKPLQNEVPVTKDSSEMSDDDFLKSIGAS